MLKRTILLAVGPLVALAVAVAVPLLHAGRLPGEIATHWGLGGRPDDATSLTVFVLGVALACLITWAALLWQARSRAADGTQLTAGPYAWAALAFVAGLVVVTTIANVDAATWREAEEVGVIAVLPVLALSALAGLAAHLLERDRPVALPADGDADAVASGAAAGVELRPGERAVWTRGLVSRPAAIAAVVTGLLLVVAGVLVGGATGWVLVALGVLAGLVLSTITEIVATVDERGLTIAYGPFGWPRQTVPLAEISRAETTVVDPWRVGGWGYRARGRGRTAIVIRGGEGVRVVRTDGRELLVTVPDAARAASLLTALATR